MGIPRTWEMKIRGFIVFVNMCSAEKACTLQVQNYQQCQAVCDNTSYCEAWSYNNANNNCYMKERIGWSPQTNPDFTSGLKNQAPLIEPDTEFKGGDYIC